LRYLIFAFFSEILKLTWLVISLLNFKKRGLLLEIKNKVKKFKNFENFQNKKDDTQYKKSPLNKKKIIKKLKE